jgi:hypothetical protein
VLLVVGNRALTIPAMTKTGILASSPTKEKLQELINEYFHSLSLFITDDNRIFNTFTNMYLSNYIVEHKRGRWYFKINTNK